MKAALCTFFLSVLSFEAREGGGEFILGDEARGGSVQVGGGAWEGEGRGRAVVLARLEERRGASRGKGDFSSPSFSFLLSSLADCSLALPSPFPPPYSKPSCPLLRLVPFFSDLFLPFVPEG